MEYDFRTIIYEHLTRMSFSFYDRVQSGQLIFRANSDIRAVQMYLTFGPSVMVQCAIVIVAFAEMLSLNAPLAVVAMLTMPFVAWVGVHMRKVLFPVSWLIQARLADVASIVDENINGVRVVKSFAAEDAQLKTLARAADKVRWGPTRKTPTSGPPGRRPSRTCRGSASPSCCSSAAGWRYTATRR
jgi:ATP-binding cassette subfamily B protein